MAVDPLQAWTKSRNDALLFATQVLGFAPRPWQEEALTAISANDRVAIRAGHGVGKTAYDAWTILWFMSTRKECKVPVTANSQDQLRDTIWPEIAKAHQRMPADLRDMFEITTERVVRKDNPDNAFAVARVGNAHRPEALQGFHSDNLLFIICEAAGIDEKVFEVAQGALSETGSKVSMDGNPTRLSGFFYEAFHRNRSRWYTMKVSCEDVPEAKGHIEDISTVYGKDSNAYRIRVLGEFPTTEDEQVIPLEWVEASLDREVDPSSVGYVWGLDVARHGDDRVTLAKRRGNTLTEPIQSWKKLDLMQTVGKVIKEYETVPKSERPDRICVDVIGMGYGVYDRLREQGIPCYAVNVGEQASANDRYLRLRDELWFKGREWFESKTASMPQDDELIEELTAPTYTFTSSGKIVVEQKSDVKARIRKSPDLADAFLLTLAVRDRSREYAGPRDRYDGRGRKRRWQQPSWMTA